MRKQVACFLSITTLSIGLNGAVNLGPHLRVNDEDNIGDMLNSETRLNVAILASQLLLPHGRAPRRPVFIIRTELQRFIQVSQALWYGFTDLDANGRQLLASMFRSFSGITPNDQLAVWLSRRIFSYVGASNRRWTELSEILHELLPSAAMAIQDEARLYAIFEEVIDRWAWVALGWQNTTDQARGALALNTYGQMLLRLAIGQPNDTFQSGLAEWPMLAGSSDDLELPPILFSYSRPFVHRRAIEIANIAYETILAGQRDGHVYQVMSERAMAIANLENILSQRQTSEEMRRIAQRLFTRLYDYQVNDRFNADISRATGRLSVASLHRIMGDIARSFAEGILFAIEMGALQTENEELIARAVSRFAEAWLTSDQEPSVRRGHAQAAYFKIPCSSSNATR